MRRTPMRHLRTLLALLLAATLAACAGRPPDLPPVAQVPPASASEPPTPAPNVCRTAPDGGIPLADRGIGGTGAPLGAPLIADRGIGGTGAPSTGIVGVITGFASVCLAGEEVPYPPNLPVLIDGQPGQLTDLRAGQVAAIGATGPQPIAQTLAIRHEVSGLLDAINPDGTLLVAGQHVIPPPPLPGGPTPTPGQWLAVSGFRREDGVILATRLDPRVPGPTIIRGLLRAEAGRAWIGDAEIRPTPSLPPGTPVLATGKWRDGGLDVATLEPDALLQDPSAYFNGAPILVIEGYAEGGFIGFGRLRYSAPFRPGLGILRLERGPGGAFRPTSIRPFDRAPGGPDRPGFAPAPTANRNFGPRFAPSFAPGLGSRFPLGGFSGARGVGRASDDGDPRPPSGGFDRGSYGGFGGGYGGFGGPRGGPR